jgi:hypothetical protein
MLFAGLRLMQLWSERRPLPAVWASSEGRARRDRAEDLEGDGAAATARGGPVARREVEGQRSRGRRRSGRGLVTAWPFKFVEASSRARGTDVVVSQSLSEAVMIWVWRLYLQLVGWRPLSGRAARTAPGGTRTGPRTRTVTARLPQSGLVGDRARDAPESGGSGASRWRRVVSRDRRCCSLSTD